MRIKMDHDVFDVTVQPGSDRERGAAIVIAIILILIFGVTSTATG